MQQPTYRNLKDLLGAKYAMAPSSRYQETKRPESRSSSRQNSRQSKPTRPQSRQSNQSSRPTSKNGVHEEIVSFNKMINYFQKGTQQQRTPANTNASFNSFLQEPRTTNKLNSYLDESIVAPKHITNDFRGANQQKEAVQKAEYLQRIMQNQDKFKRQPHHQQQFFQLSPHTPVQQMQSPQFKGNIELMQLIKAQSPPEESVVNDDEDEALIIDNYTGFNKQNFIFHFVIGKGGFGKVWKVELKKSRTYHAMKEMSKSKIIAKRSINSVMNEKELLTQLRHPFLVNMSYAFQDRQNLYLVMDLLTGGDLRFHIGRMRKFKEHQTSITVHQ